MSDSSARPMPPIDATTRPYWEAATRGELLLKRCADCGRTHFYPRTICPHCLSDRVDWVRASGQGTIYSFTVVHRAPDPSLADRVPYVVALVELEEGPRMMSNVVDCDPGAVSVGAAVEVRFEERAPDLSLPVFVLSRSNR